ncbi:histidine phosphatase family protein [Thermosulfuriphilus ammonigenes]|uniref:Histidine phosphatase family protein n=1 Tax=Thermosulfuriphilus ammonigenes TaxID=1936021 RepID=A0A6G7PTX4_9BACT|nr:histidine phosphatase family protein [Thermosulfuriphilus ammonigenes]MBA2848913.1 alpha-ribazole phosphatase/probable phosphoglycerate mutase [Thermosulfuriphilus ammonigenes]QIJ70971.1 histidine phosphatase family protein [Thermosulfuriphilus ammonigenes]HFB83678.1 histidine phosphatase family protein [Thermodesulfatator sp.]
MKPTRLILIRHGEVKGPKPGAFHSQQDVPLSLEGQQKMAEIARALKVLNLPCVASSDLSRTTYGADLAAGDGTYRLIDRDFREIDFGAWSGLTWEEIEELWPGAMKQRLQDPTGYRPPGGESLLDLKERVVVALERLLAGYPGKTVALFAHGGVNRVILAEALGLPLENIFRIQQDYACINLIDYFPDGPSLIRIINAPHDIDLKKILLRHDWP